MDPAAGSTQVTALEGSSWSREQHPHQALDASGDRHRAGRWHRLTHQGHQLQLLTLPERASCGGQ
jgi:hypothetical protein